MGVTREGGRECVSVPACSCVCGRRRHAGAPPQVRDGGGSGVCARGGEKEEGPRGPRLGRAVSSSPSLRGRDTRRRESQQTRPRPPAAPRSRRPGPRGPRVQRARSWCPPCDLRAACGGGGPSRERSSTYSSLRAMAVVPGPRRSPLAVTHACAQLRARKEPRAAPRCTSAESSARCGHRPATQRTRPAWRASALCVCVVAAGEKVCGPAVY